MATTPTEKSARTIRLRNKLVKIHESRRLKKSIDYLREDVARHAKVSVSDISLSKDLNAYVMYRVARKMVPVRIVVEKDGNKVNVDLSQELKKKSIPQGNNASSSKNGVQSKKAETPKGSAKNPAAQKNATGKQTAQKSPASGQSAESPANKVK